jgi:hypothetical protein
MPLLAPAAGSVAEAGTTPATGRDTGAADVLVAGRLCGAACCDGKRSISARALDTPGDTPGHSVFGDASCGSSVDAAASGLVPAAG